MALLASALPCMEIVSLAALPPPLPPLAVAEASVPNHPKARAWPLGRRDCGNKASEADTICYLERYSDLKAFFCASQSLWHPWGAICHALGE